MTLARLADDPRHGVNPLFNDNRLKLGIFGNNGPSTAMTTVPELFDPTWDNSVRVSRMADAAGLEAIVPYARWRPFGGPRNNSGRVFETYTWAAATAASTSRACVMSTSHVPTIHPLVAAKQGMTVDHVAHGRFAINIVCGWFAPEIEMFGGSIREHDLRYAHADEWIQVIKRAWTEQDPFDFEGEFVRVKQAIAQPKPVQTPFPALMNAGGSAAGQHFAAKHCDIAFIVIADPSPDAIRAQVEQYRSLARDEYGRHIQIWVHSYCVQRDSEAEATAYVDRYIDEFGDNAAADEWMKYQVERDRRIPPEIVGRIRRASMAGGGGVPLLGRPEQIADRLQLLSDCGIDGVLLAWIDYEDGLNRFTRDVLPLLASKGLRKAVAPDARVSA